MKEYRLKQWYPSLNSNWKGENIVIVEKEYYYHLHPSLRSKKLSGIMGIDKGDVENNPEFWEEIKPVQEKDYEILQLKAGNEIFHKTTLNRWHRQSEERKEGYYPNLEVGQRYLSNPLEIHSVKRLSDGEVFTVGDNVEVPKRTHEFYKKNKYPIYSFYNENDIILARIENGCHTPLKELKHDKTLFTTEDGVDVYNGWTVYQVSLVSNYQIHTTVAREEITPPPSYFKYFSTMEAAQEYVIREKPVLNAIEITDIIKPYLEIDKTLTTYAALYDAIKKKLNNS